MPRLWLVHRRGKTNGRHSDHPGKAFVKVMGSEGFANLRAAVGVLRNGPLICNCFLVILANTCGGLKQNTKEYKFCSWAGAKRFWYPVELPKGSHFLSKYRDLTHSESLYGAWERRERHIVISGGDFVSKPLSTWVCSTSERDWKSYQAQRKHGRVTTQRIWHTNKFKQTKRWVLVCADTGCTQVSSKFHALGYGFCIGILDRWQSDITKLEDQTVVCFFPGGEPFVSKHWNN